MGKEIFVVACFDSLFECFVREKSFSLRASADEYRIQLLLRTGAPDHAVKVFLREDYHAQYKGI